MEEEVVLVADVGGTNARIALYKNGQIINLEKFKYSEQKKPFESFAEIVDLYLSKYPQEKITMAVVGTAGNIVDNKVVSASNLKVIPDMAELQKLYSLKSVKLVNDFVLPGMAIPELDEKEYEQVIPVGFNIKPSKPSQTGKKGVIGPGTGLGNCRVRRKKRTDRWDFDASEAGQSTVPDFFKTQEYNQIQTRLEEKIGGALTIEKFVSGRALEIVYEALLDIYQQPKPAEGFSAQYVTQKYKEEKNNQADCPHLKQVEDKDCLASKAHVYFYTFWALHTYNMIVSNLLTEVFFVGNIVRDSVIREDLKSKDSVFFDVLYNKTPQIMNDYIKKVPIYIVETDDVAFKGLKLLAKQEVSKQKEKEAALQAAKSAEANKKLLQDLAILAGLATQDEQISNQLAEILKLSRTNPRQAYRIGRKIIRSSLHAGGHERG